MRGWPPGWFEFIVKKQILLRTSIAVGLGLLGWHAFSRDNSDQSLPFELRRVEKSYATWSTGGRTYYWEYSARWRGKKLKFTTPGHSHHSYEIDGEDTPIETFWCFNMGWALGTVKWLTSEPKKQSVASEMLLICTGDPANDPRWFLLKERDGALDATWLSSSNDVIPIWKIWPLGKTPPRPVQLDTTYAYAYDLGLYPLRNYESELAFSKEAMPRYILAGDTTLLDTGSLQTIRLPRPDKNLVRRDPFCLSPEGDIICFWARRSEELGIEQIAIASGEVRWTKIDKKKLHLRYTIDATPAWIEKVLLWQSEIAGGPRWVSIRPDASAPFWVGEIEPKQLHATERQSYSLRGYTRELMPEAVATLQREAGTKLVERIWPRPEDVKQENSASIYGPEEICYQLNIEEIDIMFGYSSQGDVYAYVKSPVYKNDVDVNQANHAIERLANCLNSHLGSGEWEAWIAPE